MVLIPPGSGNMNALSWSFVDVHGFMGMPFHVFQELLGNQGIPSGSWRNPLLLTSAVILRTCCACDIPSETAVYSGWKLGRCVGIFIGTWVGCIVGFSVGALVGWFVLFGGRSVGRNDGASVGALDGSFELIVAATSFGTGAATGRGVIPHGAVIPTGDGVSGGSGLGTNSDDGDCGSILPHPPQSNRDDSK